jgi:hypothetical protein
MAVMHGGREWKAWVKECSRMSREMSTHGFKGT